MRSLLLTLLATLLAAQALAGTFTSQITVEVLDASGRRLVFGEQEPRIRLAGHGYVDEQSGDTCSFNVQVESNETSLSFNLTVYWLGAIVYRGAILLVNGSSRTVEARVNATRVKLLGVDDEGRETGRCKLELEGPAKLAVECGATVSLPLGLYRVKSAELLLADHYVPVEVEEGEFEVSSGSGEVRVRLGVASSVTLRVVKADGSPLVNGTFQLFFLGAREPVSVYNGSLEDGSLTLKELPYGNYLAEVYWDGTKLLSRSITLGPSSGTITLATSLMPRVELRLLDADGYPLANTLVRAEGAGFSLTSVTDEGGWASLRDVLPGFYNVSIKWLDRTISAPIYIGEMRSVTVRMPLRTLEVVLTPEGAGELPPSLKARLLYGPEGRLLAEAALDEPSPQLRLAPPSPIPIEVTLRLAVYWGDRLLLEEYVEPYSRVRHVSLPFASVEIEVVDAAGHPLPGAALRVEDSLGVHEAVTDQYGRALFKHLYGEGFEVEAGWRGVPVAKETIAASEGEVVLRTYVYDLQVMVRGALGQPIAGALVEVEVSGPGFSLKVEATTGGEGLAKVERVPAPPASALILRVAKGRAGLAEPIAIADLEGGVVEVSLDLLLDYGWLQLRVGEFALLAAAAVVMGVVVALAYRALRVRLAARRVLSEYRLEWEAAPSSFWDRLKSRVRAVLGGEVEEEEEELFEEL